MQGNYILGENGEPVPATDVLVWARWFETADRSIARDDLGALGLVSTVFLGLDHNFDRRDPRPVLWESMIFGGPLDQTIVRYRSREDALSGHEVIIEQLRAIPQPAAN